MKKTFSLSSIKWKHTLIIGLLFAVAYILVDDNNIVPRSVEDIFYYLAWLSFLVTIFLAFCQVPIFLDTNSEIKN